MAFFAGNSPVTGAFPAQWPVTRSFDIFFDLRLNKRLSKQSWGWWFEPIRAHYDVIVIIIITTKQKYNKPVFIFISILVIASDNFIHWQCPNHEPISVLVLLPMFAKSTPYIWINSNWVINNKGYHVKPQNVNPPPYPCHSGQESGQYYSRMGLILTWALAFYAMILAFSSHIIIAHANKIHHSVVYFHWISTE